MVPEWQHLYLDYDRLKKMIKELEEKHLYIPQITDKGMIAIQPTDSFIIVCF